MSAPAAAPSRRVLAQARFETATLLRNGEQLLVSVILPAMTLVGLTYASVPAIGGPRIDTVAPGVLGLAVVSTAFTGQAISTAFDRRYGVLKLLGVTPLGRGGLLLGKAAAVLSVLAVQVLVLGGIALALGWRPAAAGMLPALVTAVLGSVAFTSLALLLAGTVRAEAVLAVANLLWVVFLLLGLVLPAGMLPGAVRVLASWSPSGALGAAMRSSLLTGQWPWGAWAVLLVWGGLAALAASRLFRWAP